MSIPVALQLYTVRDALEADFQGTLYQVRDMGYEGVELSGLNGADPYAVKKMLDNAGLKVMSSHVPLQELTEDTDDMIRRYSAAGCQFVAIPWMPPEMCNTAEALRQTVERIAKLGQLLAEKGMTLLYHNHDFEFKQLGGEYILDILYRDVPEAYLKTQIDTCWVRFAGIDPAEYLLKYAGRAPLVHLKDFSFGEDESGTPYELIGNAAQATESGFEFRPVGHGVQDMPSILSASESVGAQWVIVEQDKSVGRTTLEAAMLSRDYLKSLGW